MAKRDTKGTEGGAADGAVADGAEVEGKKKGKFVLILIPLILLGLGGGGFVAYSQYVPLTAVMQEGEAPVKEGEPVEYGEFMEIDNLIINPSGTDGTRYLMVKIGLESDKPKALEELIAKNVVVRDAILRVLSSKTVDDLAAIEKRDALKEDVRGTLNEILEKGEITRLYFTQYVLQ